MSVLPVEPDLSRLRIAGLKDVVATALVLERYTVQLYQALAADMVRQGDDEVARTFLDLAAMETQHVAEVAAWGQAATGQPLATALPDAGAGAGVVWGEVASPAAEEAASALLTPFQALSIAVRIEERGFAFYTYISANTADATVRRAAEMLARQELQHAALLRRDRRRAWRRQHGHDRAEARLHALAVPADGRALAALAWALEREAAAVLGALGLGLEPGPARTLLERLATEATLRADHQQAAAGSAITDMDPQTIIGLLGEVRPDPVSSPAVTLTPALQLMERLYDIYAALAERAYDEAVMSAALALAEGSVAALALLRESFVTPENT